MMDNQRFLVVTTLDCGTVRRSPNAYKMRDAKRKADEERSKPFVKSAHIEPVRTEQK